MANPAITIPTKNSDLCLNYAWPLAILSACLPIALHAALAGRQKPGKANNKIVENTLDITKK